MYNQCNLACNDVPPDFRKWGGTSLHAELRALHELYMRFTCILHPACKKQHVWCNKNANLCNFDCSLIQLHVILHYIPHYMKKCITWKLHDNYMIYYMYYKHFTSVSLFSHLKKGITWKLLVHDNYTIYYMYYQHFTFASFFSHL